jgi:predicted amidohydrolase
MENLRLTLIQSSLHWENSIANMAMFEEKIGQLQGETDLIVLPEMFTTGFSMNASALAEHMNMTTFKWMKQQAAQTGAVITGSYIVKEKDNFYNRLLWMRPDGSFEVYDKRHLFRMAEEHHTYAAGKSRIIPVLKGWRICPLICYDLRFPVWSRNCQLNFHQAHNPQEPVYDCLIYIANWPAVRSHAWSTLLQARAIENLSYVAGVNRIGTDGKGNTYSGDSALISFKGERLFFQADEEFMQTVTLDAEELTSFRHKFPAYMDADSFFLNQNQD